MRQIVKAIKNTFLKDFPIFKRVSTSRENGDVYETSRELVADEKEDFFRPASSPDAFADAVNRVSDVSFIDKFEAIAQLNAAIANIEYVKPTEPNPDEK